MNWHQRAACRPPTGISADELAAHVARWFPDNRTPSTEVAAVVAICRACPVRRDCLDEGLRRGDAAFGIWGAMSERARKRLRKARRAAQTKRAG